ncbi:MAG: hypothetical protein WBW31_01410, partial [Candidatus Sulfotelmatobacter sp.]
HHASPTTLVNVFSQWILGNSIKCTHLNKRKFWPEFEQPAADNVVEFQSTKERRFKELTWTIARSSNLVAERA